MKVTTVIALAALSLVSFSSLEAEVVMDEDGRTRYEFLGLEHYTVQSLQDTLSVLAPGVPLGRCAAYLTEVLGFPEASVILHLDSIGHFWVVTVVEPEERGRLRYYKLPDTEADTITLWAKAYNLAEEDKGSFQAAISSRAALLKNRETGTSGTPVPEWADTSKVKELWSALDSLTGIEQLELAIETLELDSNRANRFGAIAILSNFPQDDRAWYTVVKTMTVRDQVINGMASSLLYSFAEHYSRNIDWSPVIKEIRALLSGVNLFGLQTTLKALKGSSMDYELAKQIHTDRFQILGLWLIAEHEPTRTLVVDYLRAVSGEDFGTDLNKWEQWAHSDKQ